MKIVLDPKQLEMKRANDLKEKELVKFKNSWFEKWGQQGYGYLPYAYIERYMMDAWSSVDIEDPNPLTLASVINYREKALG